MPEGSATLYAVTSSPKSTLLLLDGHSLAYRAFYGLPADNFATSSGQHTNAVYGFLSMLINVVRDEAPTHIAVAFDVSRKTFRTEEYSDYKANRAKSPDEFTGQVPLIKEALGALGVAVFEKDGFEADDLLATLVTKASAEGLRTLVCTGDRDALQLVTDTVTVLYPRKGTSDLAHMTPDAVTEKHGVPPERYPDVAALVGETSDNLPGVPGVGPKTAVKWLTKYGDLDGVLEHAEEIKGKVGESLRQHLEGVRRNRRLNALVRDVDVAVEVADLAVQPVDVAAVDEVFAALEFTHLRARLLEAFENSGDEGETTAAEVDVQVVSAQELTGWFAAQEPGEPVGLFVVGADAGSREPGTAVAVAAAPDRAVYAELDEQTLAALMAGCAGREVVCHDVKAVLHALSLTPAHASAGPAESPLADSDLCDVSLLAYLIAPDVRSRSLTDIALRYVGVALPEALGEASGQLEIGVDLTGEQAGAAAARAAVLLPLRDAVAAKLQEHSATDLAAELEIPLIPVLYAMERTGVAVDEHLLESLHTDFADAAEQARQRACEIIDTEVNLGSPKQLQEVLFDRLDMPKTKKIKTGYSTDAASLADLYEKTEHPFLECLLRHREVVKQLTTVEGLQRAVERDGRIRTRFLQTAAATGRLSSTDPNLQNIPVRTPEGRRIREVFVAGDGYDGLLSADYSQIELRIMAHLSGDDGLIGAFRSGEDLHSYVGSQVFGVSPDDVTPAMRAKVKAMSYGLAYGLSSFGLSKQLRISDGEARNLMDMFFERFNGVRTYLAGVVDEARQRQYTETMMGRRRYLPDLTSTNRQRRDMAERMALNAPIQGSAADIVKVAMLHLDDRLAEAGLEARLLLQVHDEVILEVADRHRDAATELVVGALESAAELTVPLQVATGWGPNWQAAGH